MAHRETVENSMSENTPPDDKIVQEVMEANRVSEDNYHYYEENANQLEERYDGQIIAIIEQEVVAHQEFTTDISELQEFFNTLRSEYGEHRAREAYITHVPESDEFLVL